MSKDTYFQFPLCALAFGQTVCERLNAIIAYSVVEAGAKLFQKLTAEQKGEFLQKTESRMNPNGVSPNNRLQCAARYGAEVIGVKFQNFTSVIEKYGQLRNYIAEFEARHGTDALVRMKSSWLFDARDGHGITHREFNVLCAIYSAIGDKEMAIITRDRIRRCALGYRTAKIMEAALPLRVDMAQSLTERQLRDTIQRLHCNKFFARCTVGRRHTYYSIRLNGEAFRKRIFERRTYRPFFHDSQSALDQVLTDAIKQKRREACISEPKAPPLTPRFIFTPPGDSR